MLGPPHTHRLAVRLHPGRRQRACRLPAAESAQQLAPLMGKLNEAMWLDSPLLLVKHMVSFDGISCCKMLCLNGALLMGLLWTLLLSLQVRPSRDYGHVMVGVSSNKILLSVRVPRDCANQFGSFSRRNILNLYGYTGDLSNALGGQSFSGPLT
jgi:hypothetical protein